ncbi:hypothetical protein KUV89_01875 [Marinobacter hydrocarbonoclasticus]|nr:hypothetical protein [Marinobacter nauticus]
MPKPFKGAIIASMLTGTLTFALIKMWPLALLTVLLAERLSRVEAE